MVYLSPSTNVSFLSIFLICILYIMVPFSIVPDSPWAYLNAGLVLFIDTLAPFDILNDRFDVGG